MTVITCAPNVPAGVVYPGYRNAWTVREQVDGIDVVRIWTFVAANKGTLRRSLNYLSYLMSAIVHVLFWRRPDVIVATSPQFFCGWAGTSASWLKQRPFVLEIRDIWPESLVEVGVLKARWPTRVLQWLEKAMYRSADHIVTVGQGYRARLLERGVPAEKISVICNGVDRELFDADAWTGASEPPASPFICSYVGTIGMACGLEVVLRAAAQLRERSLGDFVFHLIGDGAKREELQSAAKNAELENVVFLGRRDKSEIPELLRASHACLVHLKESELFKTVLPSKMFEAMAMKRPVILGVAGDAARVLSEAQGGICIAPEDEEQLIDAMITLKQHPVLAATLSEQGYQYVMRRHDRDDLAADYLKLVSRFASGGAAVESTRVTKSAS